MRKKETKDGLSVRAIAGTYVVMLTMDLAQGDCDGLLGFAIHRTDHTEGKERWLKGAKTFKSAPPAAPAPGAAASAGFETRRQPIQDFSWSDFSAKPGHRYTYRVEALYGRPADPEPRRTVAVDIETESEAGGDHDVFFNRGASATQEYARRFGNRPPDEVGQEAFTWLSRGLHEALTNFIKRAQGPGWGLRVAAYEFTEESVLAALSDAVKRKADVRVVYHAREGVDTKVVKEHGQEKEVLTQTGANRAAVRKAGLEDVCKERISPPRNAISHNKFIVLMRNEEPVAVLTGSTNFSKGGIFGHSNLVQVVDDPAVAATFLEYWKHLDGDPHKSKLAPLLTAGRAIPAAAPDEGTTCVFSPRSSADALAFYCRLASEANEAIFVTLAFGMNKLLHEVFERGPAPLRFGLMEKMAMSTANKVRDREEEAKIIALRKMPENRIAVGSFIPDNAFDRWVEERLTGLNKHVRYLHTKYMLLDPLSEDPILVTGSANFSDASCIENDENMLVIRGNKRVADIYLGEFMRLYKHFSFAEFVASGAAKRMGLTPQFLDEENKWWRQYFGDTPRARLRRYFATGSPM